MLLYSTLLCKKIARAPGGHKKVMLTKLGGGGGGEQNRSQNLLPFKNFDADVEICEKISTVSDHETEILSLRKSASQKIGIKEGKNNSLRCS